MKKISPIILLLASFALAQSSTSFRRLDPTGVRGYGSPEEYNAWAGASLSYPLVGAEGSFDLNFGLSGKIVLDFTKIDLGRSWYVLTYGNISTPAPKKSVYSALASEQDGVVFGVQGYTIFGKIYRKALTAIVNGSAKLNSFGSTQVYSYRFGGGAEASFAGEGLPLVVNFSPAYVMLNDKAQFSSVQGESSAKGFWTADAFFILPVGDKIGLLVQGTFTENIAPLYRAGIVLSAGL